MKPTIVQIEIAKTLILQHEIFNCSIKDTWDNHLHPGVKAAHSFENILPVVNQLLQEKQNTSAHNTPNQDTVEYKGLFVQHAQHVVALIKTNKGEQLQVFKDGECIYKHPQFNLPTHHISIIIRRKFNFNRFNPQWRMIVHQEFINLIHEQKIVLQN